MIERTYLDVDFSSYCDCKASKLAAVSAYCFASTRGQTLALAVFSRRREFDLGSSPFTCVDASVL